MKKKDAGFSVVELLLIVVVITLLVGAGYMVYKRRHSATTSSVQTQTQAKVAPAGTTASIDSITSQDASSEAAIDKSHTSTTTTNAQSANGAAANIGSAYNESSL